MHLFVAIELKVHLFNVINISYYINTTFPEHSPVDHERRLITMTVN